MPLFAFTAQEYAQQFQRLLPRGRVWHRGWGMVQDQVVLLLMPTWVRLHVRLNDLIAQIFPCTTTELLPEWEDTLGLPDPCTGPLGTLQQRMAAVCAKFTARGGQSKTYFIAVAAALGFEITITEFQPFRAGVSRVGDALYGYDWIHTWRVNAAADTIIYFRTGQSTAGEPLRAWGNRLLECVLQALKPAHTILIFSYGDIP
ncbi:MAG TPA: putative phage tail protein [Xanthobacteraceae bacterium]|nr:putative phage tail protein [Xanthobacteraceae bacterium]